MGILDPFWNAVDTTIAGAGATVGGAIQGIGDGITQTGRNVGDSLAGAAAGYGNYVNDSANYVRDATGAPGIRAGSASNPLGLTRNKDAAKMTGMPKYSAPNKGGQKTLPPPPTAQKTIGPSDKQRSLASTNAANLARAQAAKRREATAAGQNKTGTVTGKPQAKTAGGAPTGAPKPAAKAPTSAAKKPTPTTGKPSAPASQGQKKTGGTVTGRPTAGKPAAGVKK